VRHQGRRAHRGGAQEKKHRIEDLSRPLGRDRGGHRRRGGSALIHAVSALDENLGLTGDEATGVNIVRRAVVESVALDRGERRHEASRLDKVRNLRSATVWTRDGEYGDP